MSVLDKYIVAAVLAITLFPALGISMDVDKCDVEYRRCQFFCVEENPIDREKLAKCNRRCRINKVMCETKATAKNLWNKMKKVLKLN